MGQYPNVVGGTVIPDEKIRRMEGDTDQAMGILEPWPQYVQQLLMERALLVAMLARFRQFYEERSGSHAAQAWDELTRAVRAAEDFQ